MWYIRRKLELTDVKRLPEIRFSYYLPDFAVYPQLSLFLTQSSLFIIVFCYFIYHVIPFSQNVWQFFIINCMFRQAQARFPLFFFLQFSSFVLTSITSRFGTQLRSVILTISYRQLVVSFLLYLLHVSVTCTHLINFEFFQKILYWYPLNPKAIFRSRSNYCHFTSHD
jgi:hypothetical protein